MKPKVNKKVIKEVGKEVSTLLRKYLPQVSEEGLKSVEGKFLKTINLSKNAGKTVEDILPNVIKSARDSHEIKKHLSNVKGKLIEAGVTELELESVGGTSIDNVTEGVKYGGYLEGKKLEGVMTALATEDKAVRDWDKNMFGKDNSADSFEVVAGRKSAYEATVESHSGSVRKNVENDGWMTSPFHTLGSRISSLNNSLIVGGASNDAIQASIALGDAVREFPRYMQLSHEFSVNLKQLDRGFVKKAKGFGATDKKDIKQALAKYVQHANITNANEIDTKLADKIFLEAGGKQLSLRSIIDKGDGTSDETVSGVMTLFSEHERMKNRVISGAEYSGMVTVDELTPREGQAFMLAPTGTRLPNILDDATAETLSKNPHLKPSDLMSLSGVENTSLDVMPLSDIGGWLDADMRGNFDTGMKRTFAFIDASVSWNRNLVDFTRTTAARYNKSSAASSTLLSYGKAGKLVEAGKALTNKGGALGTTLGVGTQLAGRGLYGLSYAYKLIAQPAITSLLGSTSQFVRNSIQGIVMARTGGDMRSTTKGLASGVTHGLSRSGKSLASKAISNFASKFGKAMSVSDVRFKLASQVVIDSGAPVELTEWIKAKPNSLHNKIIDNYFTVFNPTDKITVANMFAQNTIEDVDTVFNGVESSFPVATAVEKGVVRTVADFTTDVTGTIATIGSVLYPASDIISREIVGRSALNYISKKLSTEMKSYMKAIELNIDPVKAKITFVSNMVNHIGDKFASSKLLAMDYNRMRQDIERIITEGGKVNPQMVESFYSNYVFGVMDEAIFHYNQMSRPHLTDIAKGFPGGTTATTFMSWPMYASKRVSIGVASLGRAVKGITSGEMNWKGIVETSNETITMLSDKTGLEKKVVETVIVDALDADKAALQLGLEDSSSFRAQYPNLVLKLGTEQAMRVAGSEGLKLGAVVGALTLGSMLIYEYGDEDGAALADYVYKSTVIGTAANAIWPAQDVKASQGRVYQTGLQAGIDAFGYAIEDGDIIGALEYGAQIHPTFKRYEDFYNWLDEIDNDQ